MSRVRTGNQGSAHRHTLNPRTNNQATVIHHFSKPRNDDATSSCEERPPWEWAWRADHRNCSKMSHRSDDFNIVLWSVCTPMPPRAKASAVLEQTEEPQPGMLLKIWCKFTTGSDQKKKKTAKSRPCSFNLYVPGVTPIFTGDGEQQYDDQYPPPVNINRGPEVKMWAPIYQISSNHQIQKR